MSTVLDKKTYEILIKDDIETLCRHLSDCVVRRHIIEVLRDSVNHYYPNVIKND